MKFTFAELSYLLGSDQRSSGFRKAVGLGDQTVDVAASGLASLLLRNLATLSNGEAELSPELAMHAGALAAASTWINVFSLAPRSAVAGAVGYGDGEDRMMVTAEDPGVFNVQFLRVDTSVTGQLVDMAVSLAGPVGGVLLTHTGTEAAVGIAHNEDHTWSGQLGSTREPLNPADEQSARQFLTRVLDTWALPA